MSGYFGFTSGGTQYSAQGTAYAAAAAAAAAPTAYVTHNTAPTAAAYTTPVQTQQHRTYDPYAQARPAAITKPVQVASTYNYVQSSSQRPVYSSGVTAQPAQQHQTSSNITPSSQSALRQGYEAAVYSAANNYYTQKSTGATSSVWKKPAGIAGFRKQEVKPVQRKPPAASQLHYCEVCKISCAGPMTYREHLEGQKHKKKEAAAKSGANTPGGIRGNQHQLRCELCDITCSGADAYQAHIKGIKHQKVLKLHQKLGKPIPSTDPVILNKSSSSTASATKVSQPVKKVIGPVATPKINFVGGTTLRVTSTSVEEVKSDSVDKTDADIEKTTLEMLKENEVQPVGHEYVEELKNEQNKVVSFNCKLCECKFNDPNAKEMHLKGRRHRLAYKKKVDPSLIVDIKPSMRPRKMQDRRQIMKDDYLRRLDMEERWRGEMRLIEEERYREMEYMRHQHGGPRRTDSHEDRHIMARHNSIYPTGDELNIVQTAVNQCEKGLKQVSDKLSVEDKEQQDEGKQPVRILKGVMRVGALAKGLLLRGKLNVQLVVLCAQKPTRTLLQRIADKLPGFLEEDKADGDPTYCVSLSVEQAAVLVTARGQPPKDAPAPHVLITISLTSPSIREDSEADAAPDVLDKQKCMDALAELRHAKWFQARASGNQPCVIITRIMRDMCDRIPTWSKLPLWAVELLVEKCAATGPHGASPADVLRRVLEALSSGLLLSSSNTLAAPGLYDPCEKEPTDTLSGLTTQSRDDITASAQKALRLMAFRQIHKILDMQQLADRFNSRKRTLSAEESEGGKKVKQEVKPEAE